MRLEITRPLPSDIEQLWLGFEKERDVMLQPPQSLGHLVEQWGVSMLMWIGKADRQLAAWFILYDTTFDLATAAPYSTWVTLYVVPEQRGRVGLQLCHAMIDYMRQQGLTVCYTGIRRDNMAARYLARRCGFQRCGCLPGGAYSSTLTADALLYCLPLQSTHSQEGRSTFPARD